MTGGAGNAFTALMVGGKRASKESGGGGKAKINKSLTDWEATDWTGLGNFKVASWNVAGLRACAQNGGAEYLTHEAPDILCLQETKADEKKVPPEFKNVEGYPHSYWLAAEKAGYSSVGLISKIKPLSVEFGFGLADQSAEHDTEGRLITAEFDTFYLVTTYVTNAGRGLVTLPKRMRWDAMFREHVVKLDAKKPVIICGDMNVAHEEIDLKNPKTNKKNAGFTQQERDGFTELLKAGFVDTFRHFQPDKEDAYTFWTYMMGCRAKNVGWRLDYFLVSTRLLDKVKESKIREMVFGSDHCPIVMTLDKP